MHTKGTLKLHIKSSSASKNQVLEEQTRWKFFESKFEYTAGRNGSKEREEMRLLQLAQDEQSVLERELEDCNNELY